MTLSNELTTKSDFNKDYQAYPEVKLTDLHNSRVRPIFWDIPENCSVLDVGCNSGDFMEKLVKEKKGMTVKGVDLSESAVAIAKSRGLDAVLGDGESLPFEDGIFDYVVLMEVLVHVFDPKKLLSEIKRVLKKDGVLIGSSPLKALELNIWDEKRLHRAYYTAEELTSLLNEFFYDIHAKVLNGAQMNVAWVGSYVADKPVEILFKCGSKNMKPWDYQLQDKNTLRVWMGPTQNAAVTRIRMTNYADKMNKMERTDVLYDKFADDDSKHPGDWQKAWRRSEGNLPSNGIVANQMENFLKIADMAIFQVVDSWSSIAFLHAFKKIYPSKPLIMELDDWFFDIPAYNIASNPYKPNSEHEQMAYEQIELSDVILCSTVYIKEELLKMFPGKCVFVVKNSIDFTLWDAAKAEPILKKEEGRIRIGYTGSGNHGKDLAKIEKPIIALLDEFPNLEFVTVGAMRDGTMITHDRSFVINNGWVTYDKWPSMCKGWQMDIGVAPLCDSTFNRAKSNLRWLEYSALGIPTVASKVYPFATSIKHGVDGFVVNGLTSWYETLRSLILDASKRSEIGLAASKRVRRDYDHDEVSKTYKSILDAVKKGMI